MEEKLPRKFKTLRYMDGSYCENNLKDAMTSFIYTDEVDVEHRFTNVYHYSEAEKASDRIVDWSGEFVNGFMVVRFEDGLFGYVSEETREVMKPRFLLAGDFNEYGKAMVGLKRGVSYINKNFLIYSVGWQNCVSDSKRGTMASACGSIPTIVTDFSEGLIPLASILDGESLSFIGTDGNYQFFKRYDGEITKDEYYKFHSKMAKQFNSSGYLLLGSKILFASGFYCTKDDLWKLASDEKYTFFEEMSKSFHESPFIENASKKLDMGPIGKKGTEE